MKKGISESHKDVDQLLSVLILCSLLILPIWKVAELVERKKDPQTNRKKVTNDIERELVPR
jgi:hypothetical protein